MLSPEISKLLYLRDNWCCRSCNSRNNLTPHHVIFRSHGGSDKLDNLLSLCIKCHNAVHSGHLDITVLSLDNNNLKVHFTRKNNWRPT